MGIFAFGRHALSRGAIAALLVGCGGSQPPISAPLENVSQPVTRHDPAASWMSRNVASIKTLLYISDYVTNDVFVYNYATGASVGKLAGFDWPAGQCVDAKGDIWVTSIKGSAAYEFSHGGRKPIKKLNVGNSAGCSIDPTNGDLAITTNPYGQNNVLIFKKAEGKPVVYSNSNCYFIYPPGYDDKGNLYVEGQGHYGGYDSVCEIVHNGKKLETISANVRLYEGAGVMWDGKHITLADRKYGGMSETGIYQMAQAKPGQLKAVGHTVLTDCGSGSGAFQPFIVGLKNTPVNRTLAVAAVGTYSSCQNRFDYWKYPKGGSPTKTLESPPYDGVGESVSIAP